MARRAALAGAVAWGALVFAFLQWSTPHLVDRDSLYHARYAQLLPERGLSREFAWTQESVWRDAFSDKEFLFHVLLAPFCRGDDPAPGAKIAAWLMGVGLLATLARVLSKNGIRAAWFWVGLVPALGNHFLFRMQEVRPAILSVILLLLGVHFLLNSRWRALAVVGFVYSWTYTAPHLLVAFAVIDALARGLDERRFEWRGLAFAAGGVAAGLVVHPYFPNDLRLWWVMNVQIVARAWDLGGDPVVRLGREFESVSPRSLVVSSTLVLLCFLGTFLAGAFRGGALSARTRRLVAFMLGGFLLYLLSGRFIEYFAPLALLAAASAADDLVPREGRIRFALANAAGLLAIMLTARSAWDTSGALRTYPGPDLNGAARWMKSNIPAGEKVIHLDWGDFPQLFYYDPSHRYLVGLDPMFLYVRNPARLKLLEDIKWGRRPLDPAELADAFESKWLVLRPFRRPSAEEAGLSPVFEDAGGAVYRLK
ncbi:MAG TPA: hypothetical protein VFC90_01005 [Planctomycetota bacterium]|nr:hypothetical protein [Planctomycetota bacterium]